MIVIYAYQGHNSHHIEINLIVPELTISKLHLQKYSLYSVAESTGTQTISSPYYLSKTSFGLSCTGSRSQDAVRTDANYNVYPGVK